MNVEGLDPHIQSLCAMKFNGQVELEAKAGGPAEVNILAYSGGVMSPPTWGPTVIDLSGLDITAGFPLLVDHDSSLNGVLGSGTARVQNGKLVATGRISQANDAAKKIVALSKDGFAWQSSVGITPTDTQRIQSGDTVQANGRTHTAPAGGMWLVKAGKLLEITITALGADSTTAVSIAAQLERGYEMPETTQDSDAILKAERERIQQIDEACKKVGLDGNPEVERLRAQAINDEIDMTNPHFSLGGFVG